MHYAARLDAMGLGYLHVTDGIGQAKTGATWFGRTQSTGYHGFGEPLTLSQLQTAFHGALVGNGGYTAETAAAAVGSGHAAAISFGRVYMSNPDLVERFQHALPLAPLPSKDLWFVPNEETKADVSKGYTDYKAFDPAAAPAPPTSPRDVYTTFEDVDSESTAAWAALKACVDETGACAVGGGAAASHAAPDREAAARKLISNHVRVLHDLTNGMAASIDNKALTQPALRRVA